MKIDPKILRDVWSIGFAREGEEKTFRDNLCAQKV